MDLVTGTLTLRPYVFAFLAAFLAASCADLGWRRTLAFGASVWPVAWLAEFASTRVGVPFGLYHYTGITRGRELYIANVPFMDSLSFVVLAYASFCMARAALAGRRAPRWVQALVTGVLMTALDVVIDPLAVRGDRWFLGQIFYYPDGGVYFGVPLSNFAGWTIVGAVSVGLYVGVAGVGRAGSVSADVSDGRVWPGVALYYVVLGFNLAVTAWIREWALLALGGALHALIAVTVRRMRGKPGTLLWLRRRGVQRA
jgi:putative membrane protein